MILVSYRRESGRKDTTADFSSCVRLFTSPDVSIDGAPTMIVVTT
jgi:hypothetical protein